MPQRKENVIVQYWNLFQPRDRFRPSLFQRAFDTHNWQDRAPKARRICELLVRFLVVNKIHVGFMPFVGRSLLLRS